jgi:transglutaminase/protease-like cytokinesis protein 3
MKHLLRKLTTLLLAFAPLILFAQTNGRDFKAVDDYVKTLGPLENMSMGTINNVVSRKFEDKIDRARAIYDWIASSITYDVKAARGGSKNNTPAEVLKTHKASAAGFAALYQDMCSSADIRCLTVDGFVKYNTTEINEKGTEINHTWVVVQLGQSPDTWYYVDPAWGSGYLDADMKTFTKSFTDAYFFSEKAIFNLQHFPDNSAWKLGSAPRSKGEFYDLPIIKVAAHDLGLQKFSPHDGIIKIKANKAISFSFTINGNEDISKISLRIGEGKRIKTADVKDYVYSAGVLSFSYKFDEGSFPIVILIDGKEFISYSVEAN